jgi:hypothetical protein
MLLGHVKTYQRGNPALDHGSFSYPLEPDIDRIGGRPLDVYLASFLPGSLEFVDCRDRDVPTRCR